MSAPPQDGTLEQLRRALAGQTKMHAIKKYREETGSGWAAAAEAVDVIRAGGTPGVPGPEARRTRGHGSTIPAPAPRIVERRRVNPMLVLLSLAALFGALFGLAYALTRI
jgi:hypothetical protein